MEEKHTFASTIHQDNVAEETSVNQGLAASAQRKLDLRLMPILTLVYLFAFIDRSNAGNARVLGAFVLFWEVDDRLLRHRFRLTIHVRNERGSAS
jgi:hypothetical protein